MDDYTGSKMSEDILSAALVQERKAHDFYTKLSARCEIEFVRELIDKLADEEYKHMRLIEGMLVQLGLKRSTVSRSRPVNFGIGKTGGTS